MVFIKYDTIRHSWSTDSTICFDIVASQMKVSIQRRWSSRATCCCRVKLSLVAVVVALIPWRGHHTSVMRSHPLGPCCSPTWCAVASIERCFKRLCFFETCQPSLGCVPPEILKEWDTMSFRLSFDFHRKPSSVSSRCDPIVSSCALEASLSSTFFFSSYACMAGVGTATITRCRRSHGVPACVIQWHHHRLLKHSGHDYSRCWCRSSRQGRTEPKLLHYPFRLWPSSQVPCSGRGGCSDGDRI